MKKEEFKKDVVMNIFMDGEYHCPKEMAEEVGSTEGSVFAMINVLKKSGYVFESTINDQKKKLFRLVGREATSAVKPSKKKQKKHNNKEIKTTTPEKYFKWVQVGDKVVISTNYSTEDLVFMND